MEYLRQSRVQREVDQKFSEISEVARGSYARILKARHNDLPTRSMVAIKAISLPEGPGFLSSWFSSDNQEAERKKAIEVCTDEINIMRNLNESNSNFIPRLFESYVLKNEFWYVMEYAEVGSLAEFAYDLHCMNENMSSKVGDFDDRKYPLPEALVRWFMAPVSLAMKHLHEHEFMHLDVKPDNILLYKNGNVKLCDFGMSRKFDGEISPDDTDLKYGFGRGRFGTPGFEPPESKPTQKADIWSIGMTALYLLYGTSPWPKTEDYLNILSHVTEDEEDDGMYISIGYTLTDDKYVGLYYKLGLEETDDDKKDSLDSFVKSCLKLWEHRPEVQELCEHDYLKTYTDYWATHRGGERCDSQVKIKWSEMEPKTVEPLDVEEIMGFFEDVKTVALSDNSIEGLKGILGKAYSRIESLVKEHKNKFQDVVDNTLADFGFKHRIVALNCGKMTKTYDPEVLNTTVITLIEDCLALREKQTDLDNSI